MKKIGFLPFGHWSASPHSAVRSARDVLHQSIELAVAAEEGPGGRGRRTTARHRAIAAALQQSPMADANRLTMSDGERWELHLAIGPCEAHTTSSQPGSR